MESPAEISDKQLQELLEDEECLQACRDIYRCLTVSTG